MKLIGNILAEMTVKSKWQFNFLLLLFETILGMHGRVTFEGLSRNSDSSERRFRRWFKKPFDFVGFNLKALARAQRPESEYIAAYDPSFISKAGKKTYGIGYYWNGTASKAQRGLEIGLISLVDVYCNTAYPVHAVQTPPLDEIKESTSSNTDEVTRIDFYLSDIKNVAPLILQQTKYLACDGYFGKKKFVDGIVESGLEMIGKLRHDANLRILYTGEHKKGPGRKKVFDGKANAKELVGFKHAIDVDDNILLYSGILYHVSLKRIVKVVAVRYIRDGRIGTAVLFSTDLSLDALKIYHYYKARFQIEFLFRDAKQYTGLNDCQSRNKESIYFHVNASLSVLGVVKVLDQLKNPDVENRKPFSMASYKTLCHNEIMIERISAAFNLDLRELKSNPCYEELLQYGTIRY